LTERQFCRYRDYWQDSRKNQLVLVAFRGLRRYTDDPVSQANDRELAMAAWYY